jgi:hypothetical protein
MKHIGVWNVVVLVLWVMIYTSNGVLIVVVVVVVQEIIINNGYWWGMQPVALYVQ